MPEPEVSALVGAAAGGDAEAWRALVQRFSGLVWSVTRAHGLGPADAADVSQTAWLRLVEHLTRIREPERVGAWLASTTRHECIRVLRQSGRQVPTDLDFDDRVDDDASGMESALVAAQERVALWQVFETLPPRCRALLRVLMTDPPPSYDEVAAALEMPIGSIGPTRARCLERLRHTPEVSRIRADPGGSSTKEVTP
ncbi:MAG: sigma-70 family RNA polymerase sigma factor [Actinomycetota bacterium]|nr:sigma-70 family RNA polymerase sigma factor [Actinomycetota bacterium]